MLKKYFVETNAYNCVVIADDADNAIVLHEHLWAEPLTLEAAKEADYSQFDGCETIEEAQYPQSPFRFDKNADEYANVTEFGRC